MHFGDQGTLDPENGIALFGTVLNFFKNYIANWGGDILTLDDPSNFELTLTCDLLPEILHGFEIYIFYS